jgi:hypothetical protein
MEALGAEIDPDWIQLHSACRIRDLAGLVAAYRGVCCAASRDCG